MSQLESKTKVIGDYKFEVYKLSPLDANGILIDIAKTIGPALGSTIGTVVEAGGVDELLDSDMGSKDVSAVIGSLLANLSKERMNSMIETLAKSTHCNGKKLSETMDIVFRGDLPLMYQWLGFALKVNFENFTGWLGVALKGVVPALSKSQTTSKGTGQQ